jgi:arginine deiminase
MVGCTGVDSEVGRLRTVLVHRPGQELRRVTPRMRDGLMFGGLPWAERAQAEHDVFAKTLRDRGVEVLYLTELLQDVLEYAPAREQITAAVLADPRLGDELRGQLASYLEPLAPEALAEVLVAGLSSAELAIGSGLVFELLDPQDYIIEPLPNLVFARDWSVWVGDHVAVTSPGGRRTEAELAAAVFTHHPMFAGTKRLYEPCYEQLTGADVLLLAPGVVAIGVGVNTTPAGMERLARKVFDAGLAHTVLAVPYHGWSVVPSQGVPGQAAGHGTPGWLDTMCTVAGPQTVVMPPALAYSLTARTISPRGSGMRMSHPRPFLEAAAQAMGLRSLNLIETGMAPAGPGWPQRGTQWDDACNLLVLEPGTVLSYERNVLTNSRLEAAGVKVIGIPGSELAGLRGGPRALCCPVGRDPASLPDDMPNYLSGLYRPETVSV